ncbi:hypothetical protein [uncultured Kordia sp.]|uniref:hypothetical protein n=1 Tax=uncultured Kordia sp. TaxID=507699 RepID=UPI0026263288|nr:hypothetical protein [uncultured Kordia sp.]
MKLKTICILLVFFLSVGLGYAQKVKIKKGIVYFDEVAILKSDSRKDTHSFYDLNGNEIIFLRFSIDSHYSDIVYFNIKFLNQKITIESSDYDYLALSYKQSIVNIIKWFLKENVLTTSGKINTERLAVFQYKYHEDISSKTGIYQKIDCDCDCNN